MDKSGLCVGELLLPNEISEIYKNEKKKKE